MKIYIGGLTWLANYFLAGAALSVLAAAPAAAQAPDVYFPAIAPQLRLHSGLPYHAKTNIRDTGKRSETFTETVTFTGTISEPVSYKKWVELWALDSSCKRAKAQFPKKTDTGKIRITRTTNNIEIFYKLESKTATSDSFSGNIESRNCVGHTDLNLIVNADLNISH